MNDNIDMGNMTSKEIGDLMSRTLIDRGKEMAAIVYPRTDYGDLPSRTLTDLGKQAVENGDLDDFLS
ncbi:MAG: hypothetical protein HFG40_02075 [Bacilli bacterium]|nr:hypothetical protein [Bacilli bacterium]